MKICLITDNSWVKDSLIKLIDFECNFTQLEDANDVNISYDYIFVDMQVSNNGGPSIVRELKRSEKVIDSTIVLLICLLYTSPSPRDSNLSRMPSSA